jgi:hypothetical protein
MVDMPVIVRHQDRGALRLARAVRPRWRPLLAGGVLTVVGAMASGAWGALLLPGVLFLLFAPLISATPKARRSEVERGLAVFSHPAQRRLASRAIALMTSGFRVSYVLKDLQLWR